MKKVQFINPVFCLLVVFIITSCGGYYDHYQVYFVTTTAESKYNVRLKDQFGTTEAMVSTIKYFANPVSKNEGKIYDKNTHLTWYRIEEKGPYIKRKVTFSNQFGTQTWIIGKPVYLLVPTEKKEKGSLEPDKRKHFKCYEVLSGESLKKEVTLNDQFGKQVVSVEKPMYFCTPVEKNYEKSVNTHLACYQIMIISGAGDYHVNVKNQFGEYSLSGEKSYMLCVPSEKRRVEKLGKLE